MQPRRALRVGVAVLYTLLATVSLGLAVRAWQAYNTDGPPSAADVLAAVTLYQSGTPAQAAQAPAVQWYNAFQRADLPYFVCLVTQLALGTLCTGLAMGSAPLFAAWVTAEVTAFLCMMLSNAVKVAQNRAMISQLPGAPTTVAPFGLVGDLTTWQQFVVAWPLAFHPLALALGAVTVALYARAVV